MMIMAMQALCSTALGSQGIALFLLMGQAAEVAQWSRAGTFIPTTPASLSTVGKADGKRMESRTQTLLDHDQQALSHFHPTQRLENQRRLV
jgi:hypothetical protein